MRDIKFRFRLQLNIDSWGKYKKGDIDTFFIELFSVARFCIEPHWDIISCDQFTGLKDKNGVDVYEGDIVKGWYYTVSPDHFRGTFAVEYHSGWAQFGVGIDAMWVTIGNADIEVIGNIHENKELLD